MTDELLLTDEELDEAHVAGKRDYYQSTPEELWDDDEAGWARDRGIAQAQLDKDRQHFEKKLQQMALNYDTIIKLSKEAEE